MLEFILAAIGVAGFGLAGYWDLKSTEFPDWLPYSIIILALASRGAFALIYADWSLVTGSIAVGAVFLGLGLAMYFLKQWGDGDAWLLGAMGFLFPSESGFAYSGAFPFPVALIFNFFLVAFFYVIAYSIALSFKAPGTWSGFVRSFRKECKGAMMLAAGVSAAYIAFITAMIFSLRSAPPSLAFAAAFPALIFFVVIFTHYGRYIEKNLFKRRIPVGMLRTGDVPIGGKWRVLNRNEVASLKRRGGYIWIKEGIRFAPVFVITLVVTLLAGDLFSMLFGLV